jgi:hypothetical protein
MGSGGDADSIRRESGLADDIPLPDAASPAPLPKPCRTTAFSLQHKHLPPSSNIPRTIAHPVDSLAAMLMSFRGYGDLEWRRHGITVKWQRRRGSTVKRQRIGLSSTMDVRAGTLAISRVLTNVGEKEE